MKRPTRQEKPKVSARLEPSPQKSLPVVVASAPAPGAVDPNPGNHVMRLSPFGEDGPVTPEDWCRISRMISRGTFTLGTPEQEEERREIEEASRHHGSQEGHQRGVLGERAAEKARASARAALARAARKEQDLGSERNEWLRKALANPGKAKSDQALARLAEARLTREMTAEDLDKLFPKNPTGQRVTRDAIRRCFGKKS